MAQFAILIYAEESLHAMDAAEAQLEANDKHAQDLAQSGTMALAYALTPRAEAVSIRKDRTDAQPFLSAEQLVVGFYVVNAPDLEAAVEIARLNPAVRTSTGGVEVRPVHSGGVITSAG